MVAVVQVAVGAALEVGKLILDALVETKASFYLLVLIRKPCYFGAALLQTTPIHRYFEAVKDQLQDWKVALLVLLFL